MKGRRLRLAQVLARPFRKAERAAISAALEADLAGKRAIADIKIGKRHRKDLGDITSLAANMAVLGLLQPIAVRPCGKLISGERRLVAANQLGWKEIPVHILDLDAIVRGEFAENAY